MDRHQEEIVRAFERLHRSVSLVSERIVALGRDREMLLERIGELEAINLELESRIAQQSDDEARMGRRLRELEGEVEQLQAERQRLLDEAEAVRVTATEKEHISLELQKELDALRMQLEQVRQEQRQAGDVQTRVVELERMLEEEKASGASRMEEWERRIAEAERDRNDAAGQMRILERERDQARATVESTILRVQQLESVGNERHTVLEEEKDALARDLEAALELASVHEREAESLREQLAALQAQQGAMEERFSVSEEDQKVLIGQVEQAISLIDKHLIETEEG